MSLSWQRLVLETYASRAPEVADFLSEQGALAVSFADAQDDPCYEPDPQELCLWPHTLVEGLFSGDTKLEIIAKLFRQWVHKADIRSINIEVLQDQAWERVCLDQLQPMHFGHGLWIYPTNYPLPNDSQRHIVRMDPGLAFGTGTHTTTALCLEYLSKAPLQGSVLVDYGCGSGILAIAAARLGTKRVWVVDYDPQAIYATRENAARNGLADRIEVATTDQPVVGKVDWVVANILAKPLIALAPRLLALVRPGGRLVLSGILAEQIAIVDSAYQKHCLQLQCLIREGWTLLEYQRNP